jgi:acyl carrier protein
MHTRENIRAELKRILVEVLKLDRSPEQIRDDESLESIGVDFAEAVEILRAVEKRFEVEIPEEKIDLALFQDVGSMSAAIETALARKPAS